MRTIFGAVEVDGQWRIKYNHDFYGIFIYRWSEVGRKSCWDKNFGNERNGQRPIEGSFGVGLGLQTAVTPLMIIKIAREEYNITYKKLFAFLQS